MTLLDYINKHHGGNQAAFGREIGKVRQQVNRMLKSGEWYYNEATGWLENRPVYPKFNLRNNPL